MIIDRIVYIIDNENLSVRGFEKEISSSEGVFRHAIKGKKDFSTKWLTKIAEKFPQYSLDWLVTGKGEILRTEQKCEKAEQKCQESAQIPDCTNEMLLNKICELSAQNERLRLELKRQKTKQNITSEN